jgi:1-acyl-sn-glycerol-3-phosphate acyltransferase
LPPILEQAQPALGFIPPSLSPWTLGGIKTILPLWLKHKLAIATIEPQNVERLAQLYQEFQQGKVRLLLAFRHPSTSDPFTMAYLVWNVLPKIARQHGIRLKPPFHSHFLYDRGIPLWAGGFVSWLFPRLGGSSILRGKADREGLRSARDLLVNGRFPLAVAPEGATNDHSELMNPLEPGVAQLGFWCAEDLAKAGRQETVWIVPISLKYSYLTPPWAKLDQLLDQLELDAGISPQADLKPMGLLTDPALDLRYARLLRIGEACLTQVEGFYRQSYHQPIPEELPMSDGAARNQQLLKRLHNNLDRVLQVAEDFFGITPRGSFMDRCRKLEQSAWDRMYRDDLDQLTPLQRGLANWNAAEASLRLGHMRLAERLTCITSDYILSKPSGDRFAEVILILWRISTWIKGESPHSPPHLGKCRAEITVGEAISVSDRMADYTQDRRRARQAVQELTQTLQTHLEAML